MNGNGNHSYNVCWYMHILELPYILERSIEIKLRFPISSNSRIMSATSPGEFLVAEPSVKNGPAESAKKARATEKKGYKKKLGLQRKVQPQSQTLDCLPNTWKVCLPTCYYFKHDWPWSSSSLSLLYQSSCHVLHLRFAVQVKCAWF